MLESFRNNGDIYTFGHGVRSEGGSYPWNQHKAFQSGLTARNPPKISTLPIVGAPTLFFTFVSATLQLIFGSNIATYSFYWSINS